MRFEWLQTVGFHSLIGKTADMEKQAFKNKEVKISPKDFFIFDPYLLRMIVER